MSSAKAPLSNNREGVDQDQFLTILSRRPTADETSRLVAHVKKGTPRQGYNDVIWVLLNCSEFALNR